ncbi:hypothetical protein ALC62_11104, partial [Cyphomyrmex costatus]
NIPLPDRFPFDNLIYWNIYKATFERYCTVTGIEDECNYGVSREEIIT